MYPWSSFIYTHLLILFVPWKNIQMLNGLLVIIFMSHIVPFNEPIQSKVPIGRNIGEQLCSHFACLKKNHLPSGNLPNSYWTWHSFDVDLPIKDGDYPVRKRLVYQRVHHPKKGKGEWQTNKPCTKGGSRIVGENHNPLYNQ